MLTNSCENVASKFSCTTCNYNTDRKSSYDKHLTTAKHIKLTKINKSCKKSCDDKNMVCANCDKHFKSRVGLWKHKKTCTEIIDKSIDNETILLLIKENSEFKNIIMKLVDSSNSNNNTTNNIGNIENKTFNLNLFLNETCKNAMNISEFLSSIKVNLEDLENTGRQGYVEGISNIVSKNLNKLEQHFRPIHCSDSKREVFYIKENNEWIKENQEKPILKKAIKVIANENIKQIKYWRDKYPDCTEANSKKNDMYLKIVSNSMNGITEEEGHKNIDKIISNVAKEVTINKN
jgi:hypothetical protein